MFVVVILLGLSVVLSVLTVYTWAYPIAAAGTRNPARTRAEQLAPWAIGAASVVMTATTVAALLGVAGGRASGY